MNVGVARGTRMEVDVFESPQESVTCWVLLITAGAGVIGEFNYFG